MWMYMLKYWCKCKHKSVNIYIYIYISKKTKIYEYLGGSKSSEPHTERRDIPKLFLLWQRTTTFIKLENLIRVSVLIPVQVKPIKWGELCEKSKRKKTVARACIKSLQKESIPPRKSMMLWYRYLQGTLLPTEVWRSGLRNSSGIETAQMMTFGPVGQKPQPQMNKLMSFTV